MEKLSRYQLKGIVFLLSYLSCAQSSPDEYTSCPVEFSTAEVLFCHGYCGQDFENSEDGTIPENGCQQEDADSFCKLKLCDGNAFAADYSVTTAEYDVVGFACDLARKETTQSQSRWRRKDQKEYESLHEGNYFGIIDVYFTNNTGGTHGTNVDVVSDVTCIGTPVDCVWDDWHLGDCSHDCGDGIRTNTREKAVEEQYGGVCSDLYTEVETCKIKECPVHCEWGPWAEVTTCDQPCGGGYLTEERVIATQEEHGGDACTEDSTRTVSCNVQDCPSCTSDSECTTPEECNYGGLYYNGPYPGKYCTTCEILVIGTNNADSSCTTCISKSGTLSSSDYVCPSAVDPNNWEGQSYKDRFDITQSGTTVTATRTDPDGLDGHGWGMNLQFKCCI